MFGCILSPFAEYFVNNEILCDVCVYFVPASHEISTTNFFHIATFPSPTFGPLCAFHCPLFFTKNNNLECRDVLKTVMVTSDQKRFGPYTAHN